MTIVDFNHIYIPEAAALALANYEEERTAVPFLPTIGAVPDLIPFADNGLGVATFDDGKMVGYLCCCASFDNAFGTTKAKGYTHLGVDFENFNPTAYGFWAKYFVPYTHGVVRRIDESAIDLYR